MLNFPKKIRPRAIEIGDIHAPPVYVTNIFCPCHSFFGDYKGEWKSTQWSKCLQSLGGIKKNCTGICKDTMGSFKVALTLISSMSRTSMTPDDLIWPVLFSRLLWIIWSDILPFQEMTKKKNGWTWASNNRSPLRQIEVMAVGLKTISESSKCDTKILCKYSPRLCFK